MRPCMRELQKSIAGRCSGVCVCAMCGFLQVHVHTSEQSANMDIMIRLKHDCMCTCPFAVAVSDQFLQLS